MLFRHVRNVLPNTGLLVALAFSTHPSRVFPGRTPPLLITTLEHKLKLLAEAGVDIALSLPFTPELAALTYDAFLEQLRNKLHFSHLVLGEGASFGRKRQGTEERVRALAPELGFHATYLPKCTIEGTVVSSRHIRHLIAHGALDEASRYLGRPYSIFASSSRRERDVYLFSLPELCLPPSGAYAVLLQHGEEAQLEVEREQSALRLHYAGDCSFPLEMVFFPRNTDCEGGHS